MSHPETCGGDLPSYDKSRMRLSDGGTLTVTQSVCVSLSVTDEGGLCWVLGSVSTSPRTRDSMNDLTGEGDPRGTCISPNQGATRVTTGDEEVVTTTRGAGRGDDNDDLRLLFP